MNRIIRRERMKVLLVLAMSLFLAADLLAKESPEHLQESLPEKIAFSEAGKIDRHNKLELEEVQKQQINARNKLAEGQAQWKSGMLDKAVSTLKEAAGTDPSNRQIAKVLKGMQGQKKMMDDALMRTAKLIG